MVKARGSAAARRVKKKMAEFVKEDGELFAIAETAVDGDEIASFDAIVKAGDAERNFLDRYAPATTDTIEIVEVKRPFIPRNI